MRTIDLTTIIILIAIALINLFFGYWRAATRRLSLQWILAIHIPVPVAILLRLSFLGWSWLMLPTFVAAFAIGQYSGSLVRIVLKKQPVQLTSFLMVDLLRILSLKLRQKIFTQE